MNIAVVGSVGTGGQRTALLEALTAAGGLAGEGGAVRVWLTDAVEEVPFVCGDYPVTAVFAPSGAADTPEALLPYLCALYTEHAPSLLIFAAGIRSRALAAALAHRLCGCVVQDCVGLGCVNGRVRLAKPVYSGNVLAEYEAERKPCLAVLRAHAFPAAPVSAGKTRCIRKGGTGRAEWLVSRSVAEEEDAGLAGARVIVAGGRGLRDEKDREMLEELAAALNGVTGASRPPVMNGLMGLERMIGQSGQIVSPDLCIAVGISGATPFLAGIAGAKTVVAINRDPDARIFLESDCGIVGDFREILPHVPVIARKNPV